MTGMCGLCVWGGEGFGVSESVRCRGGEGRIYVYKDWKLEI